MTCRGLVATGLAVVVLASASLAVPVAGQAPAPTASTFTPPKSTYTPPRTAWGDPDIQGMWDYQSMIPMQRPPELKGKATFTEAELEEWLRDRAPNLDRGLENFGKPGAGVGAYNEFWHNRNFIRDNRTSLIVDPPDGRLPPMTPEARKRQADDAAYRDANPYETWEDFPSYSRCIARTTPKTPQMYNSGTMIMQTQGWVIFVHEQLDTRIIPLDGRPFIAENVRQWNGDSRAHWEGSTLVVETRNFTHKQVGGGPGGLVNQGIPFGNFHVIERFVPVDAKTIHHYATITDPTTWTAPWTFMLPWERDDDYVLYEYACNEANISVGAALRGERYLAHDEAMKKAAGSK
jgi:hypothetical protein